MIKRIFDFVGSFFGLIIVFPIFIVVALAIKIEDGGPIFYRGPRVGRLGLPFRIFKFRSMVINAEKLGAASTSNSDSRITRTGALIRRYKLDEMSQLINVLLGDMSFVGPRPQVKWAVDLYNDEEKQLLQLRPGITDWASIKYHNEGEIIARSGISDPDEAYMKLIHPQKTQLQLKYLRDRSFWTDIRIIIDTVTTLFETRASRID